MQPSRPPHIESQPVAGGVVEVLANAQIAFDGLDGGVAEGELDLLERHPALVGELGEGTTQVVRRNLHSDPPAVADDGLEHRLRPHRVVTDATSLVDGPQHSAFGDAGGPALYSNDG